MNLSDVETKNIDIAVEGRKNHATVYIEKESEADSEGEEPSVHRDVVQIRDIFQFLKGKKYSPETMQHRRQSKLLGQTINNENMTKLRKAPPGAFLLLHCFW